MDKASSGACTAAQIRRICSTVRGASTNTYVIVIKVQRRGIKSVIESDLRNLRFIVRRVAEMNPKAAAHFAQTACTCTCLCTCMYTGLCI